MNIIPNRFIFNRLLDRLKELKIGRLYIEDPDGKTYDFEGEIDGNNAHIKINDWSVIGNLATKGDIGFAEDYSQGKWETNDLTKLLTLSIQNRSILDPFFKADAIRRVLYQLSYFFQRNSVSGSKKNIHAHYDLGNDFYKLWLDETMSYSAAIFKDGNESLATAQNNKYDRILDNLSTDSGRVLEIGCGWGGFAERAVARNNDFQVKGITLSTEQHDYAVKRLKQNAEIVIEDYRHQTGLFDHIVSIEMFEAVGHKYWPTYFKKIKSLLNDGGKAVIQTITIEDKSFHQYKNDTDFIRTYIFPGGMLPSPSKLNDQVEKAGLKTHGVFEFGLDYARTLDIWLEKFDSVKSKVLAQGFDERFVRLWRFYLAGCSAAFQTGYTNVCQIEVGHAA